MNSQLQVPKIITESSSLFSLRVEEFSSRMADKIQSAAYQLDLFPYLLVEEWLLLFWCPGALVELRSGTEILDQDSNLLKEEWEELRDKFTECRAGHPSAVTVMGPFRRTVIPNPLADFHNSNLRTIDTELRLDVVLDGTDPSIPDASVTGLSITSWLESGQVSCLNLAKEEHSLDTLVNALKRVLSDRKRIGEVSERDDNLRALEDSSDRAFLLEKEGFIGSYTEAAKDTFILEYASFFSPLELITKKISKAIRHRMRKFPQPESPFIFSLRYRGEQQISFFLTRQQIEDLLNDTTTAFTLDDLRRLLQFGFSRNLGLSGYVLATGHSDFTHDPGSDGRWISSSDNPEARQVLGLIERMYKVLKGASSERGNQDVFLLPLFFLRSRINGDDQLNNEILLLVECALPSNPEDQRALRLALLDLQWEFMPLVEGALLAQQQAQLRADAASARYLIAHAWSLGHNFPKFLSRPTISIVEEIGRLLEKISDEMREDLPKNRRIAVSKARDLLEYMRLMANHYSSFFAFFVKSFSNDGPTQKSGITLDDAFDVGVLETALKQFVKHRRDLLAGTNQSIIDGQPCAQYYKMDVTLASSACDHQLTYNKALVIELLINHISNSMDELARNNGDIVLVDAVRAEICITCDFQPAENNSNAGYLVVHVIDKGPGMDRASINTRNRTLAGILEHNRRPRFADRASTKAEHTGSGFLISAEILRSLHSTLQLPVRKGSYYLQPTEPAPGLTVHMEIPVRVAS